MNPSQPYSTSETLLRPNFCGCETAARSMVCWGAILAGTTAALALHVLLMMLGTGLGLSIFSPITEANPVADFSVGALIIHSICAIVSLYFGGWVAGRFSPATNRSTGWLHGFCVWCAATVGGVILVALGASAILGGLSKVVSKPAAAVASSATELAGDAMKQSGATVTSFVDESVGSLPEDGPSNESIRAKREIGIAVARYFNPAQKANAETNRAALVTALQDHAGMSQADADQSVTEWTTSYERLQADLATVKEAAETKAREAAETASAAVAKFSLWAFIAFLIGLLAATWGGQVGAVCSTRCDERTHGLAFVPTQNA